MRVWLIVKIKTLFKTQANFARACGQSDNWISRIVTCRDDPSPEDKELISSKLGVENSDERELLFLKQGQV